MAAGVPVVAAASPGIEGLIADRQSGLVVRPDNRADFAQAVRELCQDPSLAQRIGAAAQQHVRQHHNPQQIAQQYAALYAEL
jgi:glycosyltransferase involved in cell wall biosynthesis